MDPIESKELTRTPIPALQAETFRAARSASFTTLDLSASYTGFKNWKIFGSVINVFNRIAPFDPQAGYGLYNYNYNYANSGATGTQFNLGASYTFYRRYVRMDARSCGAARRIFFLVAAPGLPTTTHSEGYPMKSIDRRVRVRGLCRAARPAAQDNAAAVADLQAMQQAARKDKRGARREHARAHARGSEEVLADLRQPPARPRPAQPRAQPRARDARRRDRPLSDAYAKQVVNDLMSIEEQEIKALRKASNAAMRALPPKKAARYLQLENKLRAVQDYEIAVAFPLVQ